MNNPADLKHVICRFVYEDGVLFWAKSPHPRIKVGSVAGCPHIGKGGRHMITVDGKQYRRAVLVFYMFHGYVPESVDHRDRDCANDRIDNLRSADRSLQQHNTRTPRNNTTGEKGVTYRANAKGAKKWSAHIQVKGKRRVIHFYSRQEAIQCRRWMENQYLRPHCDYEEEL